MFLAACETQSTSTANVSPLPIQVALSHVGSSRVKIIVPNDVDEVYLHWVAEFKSSWRGCEGRFKHVDGGIRNTKMSSRLGNVTWNGV